MRKAALLALTGICACASPAPEFFGAPEQRMSVDGIRIAVFSTADRAQAIRLDRLGRGEHGPMRQRLVSAIEQATGCAVRPGSASGDSGVMTADIDC
jgi:hypothetical protein